MQYSHLTKAPISEAVLDVGIARSNAMRDDAFEAFSQAVQDRFPKPHPVQVAETSLSLSGGGATVTSGPAQRVGVICWNAEHSRAVQAGFDHYSVHHVRAYKDWAELVASAKEWWALYRDLVVPARVVRCGVRFINQLSLVPGRDLGITLRTRPEVSSGLPQVLEEYFQRLVVPFPDGVRAAITQVVQPPTPGQPTRPLVLDIDVSVRVDLDPVVDAIWSTFETLRDVKNRCFFESLQQSKWEEFR